MRNKRVLEKTKGCSAILFGAGENADPYFCLVCFYFDLLGMIFSVISKYSCHIKDKLAEQFIHLLLILYNELFFCIKTHII